MTDNAWCWYWCARHQVWGRGEACWVLGCTDVVRHGPMVDSFVFDGPTQVDA